MPNRHKDNCYSIERRSLTIHEEQERIKTSLFTLSNRTYDGKDN